MAASGPVSRAPRGTDTGSDNAIGSPTTGTGVDAGAGSPTGGDGAIGTGRADATERDRLPVGHPVEPQMLL
ncbi:hypothetical protein [Streptomyces siamensis]|uniref:Uncharacterized protein n=1 Tax=Streptomyces siamensis TaxID=1274986 RepID=A0ABP9IXG7_9ACTN